MQSSAKEVLETVSRDLKDNGYTYETAAPKLGYATRQAVGAVLSSGKYMTRAQARRFNNAFGYYEPYLLSGEGSLTGPVEEPETTSYVPRSALLLRPFDDVDQFREAFGMFVDDITTAYGVQNVHKFLTTAARYVGTLYDPTEEDLRRREYHLNRSRFGKSDTEAIENKVRKKIEIFTSDEYRKVQDGIREKMLESLFKQYSEMQQKLQ